MALKFLNMLACGGLADVIELRAFADAVMDGNVAKQTEVLDAH